MLNKYKPQSIKFHEKVSGSTSFTITDTIIGDVAAEVGAQAPSDTVYKTSHI